MTDNVPARGYSWEPFKPQHTKSVKHGVWSRSDRFISERMAELVNEAIERCSWLEPSDESGLIDWARTEARIERADRYLAEEGDWDENGKLRPIAEHLLKLQAHAAKLRKANGLEPLSRAQMSRDTAAAKVDLSILLSQRRKEREGTE